MFNPCTAHHYGPYFAVSLNPQIPTASYINRPPEPIQDLSAALQTESLERDHVATIAPIETLQLTALAIKSRTSNIIVRHTNHLRRVDLCVLEKFCRLKTVPQPSAQAALAPPAAVVP